MKELHEYSVDIPTKPMNEDDFAGIVVDRLHVLANDQDGFLTVSYPSAREDQMYFVQTYSKSETEFHVEIGLDPEDDGPIYIYGKEKMSLDETITIFHKVLVECEIPDYSDWIVIQKRVRDMDEEAYKKYLEEIHSGLMKSSWEFSAEKASSLMEMREKYIKLSYYLGEELDDVIDEVGYMCG